MRLEDVSAALRPRSPWESVDLGFAMVRRDFKRLMLAWSLTVVPLWALLLCASHWISLGTVVLIIWWLKPIYDRVPLFIVSRALFGAAPTLRETLRAWPGMIFRSFVRLMVLRIPWVIFAPRFGWARSLLLPIIDLEGQKGAGFRQRQQVLLGQAGGTASGLLLFAGLCEMIFVFGLFAVGTMLAPDPVGAMDAGQELFRSAFRSGESPTWLEWSFVGVYLLTITVVENFYVGGGFGLYLNCRTHFEGWDVEIVFRRLGQRLAKAAPTAPVVAMVLAFLLGAGSPVGAAEPQSREAEVIERVKAHDDFKVETVKERHRLDPEGNRSKESYGEGRDPSWLKSLAGLGDVLVVLFITAAVAWLAWIIYQNRHLFARGARMKTNAKPAAPRTVMGLDVSPDSLPPDLVAAARERWLAGDARGALNLLYRGALAWLVHVAQLRIRESDTEGDCVRQMRGLVETIPREYFSTLTEQWIGAAYAERTPGAATMEQLLQNWPFGSQGGRSK